MSLQFRKTETTRALRVIMLPFAAAIITGLMLAGCGGGPAQAPEKPAMEKTEAPAAAAPAPREGTSTIEGKVSFSGEAPKPTKIQMSADMACANQHPNGAVTEDVVVNPNGTLQNVFIYVKDGPPTKARYKAPETPVVMDQHGCVYHPRVFGIMAGQPLEIHNSDPTLHNVHVFSENNKAFNVGMPKGAKNTKSLENPEIMVHVKCDVHPWMAGYIGVVSNPFFAVTGEDGTFSLKGLPAGDYTIEAWHEKFGTKEIKVTVADGATATADFDYAG